MGHLLIPANLERLHGTARFRRPIYAGRTAVGPTRRFALPGGVERGRCERHSGVDLEALQMSAIGACGRHFGRRQDPYLDSGGGRREARRRAVLHQQECNDRQVQRKHRNDGGPSRIIPVA